MGDEMTDLAGAGRYGDELAGDRVDVIDADDVHGSGDAQGSDHADDMNDDADAVVDVLDDAELGRVLEALLVVVDAPVSEHTLATVTGQPVDRISVAVTMLAQALSERDSGMELRYAGGGWRMYTRARFAPYVERLLLDGSRSKLTRAALETLAVVAYRQPVTRARVSAVRGVNVDAVMRTLVARGLIIEAGTDADSGAATFVTTELFLERLGLSSLTDLPDIAPLLPDIDVIDELSDNLDSEPRFASLGGARSAERNDIPDMDSDGDD